MIIFSIPAAFAAVDDMQMLLLDRYALPMRWDNVEGPPLWVAGEKPRFDCSKDAHTVTLAAGQFVTVRIPARSVLRVIRPDGQPAACGPGDIPFAGVRPLCDLFASPRIGRRVALRASRCAEADAGTGHEDGRRWR
ncbi:MAG: hypothetical protein MZV70_13690 [Desulfobacterales bacterium]|nr:hypothetical protein [Desulfobacterales bacterium]